MTQPTKVALVALQTLANRGVEKGAEFDATPEEARLLLRSGVAEKSPAKTATAKTK